MLLGFGPVHQPQARHAGGFPCRKCNSGMRPGKAGLAGGTKCDSFRNPVSRPVAESPIREGLLLGSWPCAALRRRGAAMRKRASARATSGWPRKSQIFRAPRGSGALKAMASSPRWAREATAGVVVGCAACERTAREQPRTSPAARRCGQRALASSRPKAGGPGAEADGKQESGGCIRARVTDGTRSWRKKRPCQERT